MARELSYEVLVLDGVPRAGGQTLPTGEGIVSSPLALTLVKGAEEAILVDAPYTYGQIDRVRNWIAASGRRLTAVYITHAHGDHWLGVAELLSTFPGVTVHATPGTIERMHQEATVGRETLWDKIFPGLIPPSPVIARPLPEGGLRLEGHELRPIELGHTDTDETTALWVPSIGLLMAGDSVYNGVHQYILEATDGFDSWLAALDELAALSPAAVVAGHKAPGAPDRPDAIAETRAYLEDARDQLAVADDPKAYYDEMLRRYPLRINPGPVWYGAVGLLAAR